MIIRKMPVPMALMAPRISRETTYPPAFSTDVSHTVAMIFCCRAGNQLEMVRRRAGPSADM